MEKIITIMQYGDVAASTAALVYIYAQHIRGKLTANTLKKIAIGFGIFLAGILVIKIIAGYFFLRNSPMGSLMLPPNQSWSWFMHTMLSTYVFSFIVSLVAGISMYYAAILTNKSFAGELFAEEDKYIFVFAAFAVGWPNFIIYLLAAVILTVFLSGVSALRHGADTRIVLTDALLYAIPVTLLFAGAIAPYLKLNSLLIFA